MFQNKTQMMNWSFKFCEPVDKTVHGIVIESEMKSHFAYFLNNMCREAVIKTAYQV